MSDAELSVQGLAQPSSSFVETQAWLAPAENFDHSQRNAVLAWLRSVTGLGLGTLICGILGLAAGVLTGWREWFGLGAGALFGFAACAAMSAGRLAFSLQLRVSDRRLVVGTPGRVAIEVRNDSRRRSLPASMELLVSGKVYGVAIPSLPKGGSHAVRVPVPTERRAILSIGPVQAVRGDVLGLIRRVVTWPLGDQVYVQPRIIRTPTALAGFVRDLEGDESAQRTASDLSFHSLRDYVPGDDRRHIHWKKTARTGTLLVREFLETRRSLVVVVLSTDLADYADDMEFELAVSCAASMAAALLGAGRQVVVAVGARDIHVVTVPTTLDQFAGLLPAPGIGALAQTARRAVKRHPGMSAMIAVFGSAVVAKDVRATYQARPSATSIIGVRVAPAGAGWLARDTVSVADLDSLPAALKLVRR